MRARALRFPNRGEKMLENLRTRFILLCIMLAAVFVALSSQLAVLTLAQSDEYNVKSEKVKVSTDEIRGQRGRIYDSKSQLLAFNETSFDVQFLRTDQDTLTTEYHPMYTEIIEKTIEIIERNGGKIEDTFSIRKLVDGTFEFFWGPGIGSEAAAKREKKMA